MVTTNIANSERGFTLVEVLVVLAILGSLAGLSVLNFRNMRAIANDAIFKSDMHKVRTAMEGEELREENNFYYYRVVQGPGALPPPFQAATLSEGTTMYAYRRVISAVNLNYDLMYQYGWHKGSKWRYLRYDYKLNGRRYRVSSKTPNV